MFDLFPQFNSSYNELNVSSFHVQSSEDAVVTGQLVPSIVEQEPAREDLSVFFGIGMLVNLVMITSFFIWAVKQWKHNDKR